MGNKIKIDFHKWLPTKDNPHFICINLLPSISFLRGSKTEWQVTIDFLIWSICINNEPKIPD